MNLCFFCFFLLLISSFFQWRREDVDLCRLGDLEHLHCGEREQLLLDLASRDWDLSRRLRSFPGCGPGLPPLPPWGAAAAAIHLESFSNTSPPFLVMWFRIFPIPRRQIFGLTCLCCVCSWFFLNARTFGDVLSHEPGNFIDSLDPSLPSPPEYYKVLSSVSKMSPDIFICFIDEKKWDSKFKDQSFVTITCSKDKTNSQLSAFPSKDLSTSPTYAQALQTIL